MRIIFYPPFKPLDHANPSGDLTTARGLVQYLANHGHEVLVPSRLRTRWIYWQPGKYSEVRAEKMRVLQKTALAQPDLWLTYHSYYKAPDLLGPGISRTLGIPYVIFQGMYSTKHKRRIKTLPGFYLNRHALVSADHVLSNRKEDLKNLRRLIPSRKLTYIRPGINPDSFTRDMSARQELRERWGAGNDPVVLSTAMFRPDVKTQGLLWVIRACGILKARGVSFTLVIAGDGKERNRIEQAARRHLGGSCRLIGKVPRENLYRVYSAGDVFAFPGFNETLGMVYLEAQACGLPVVACNNGGISEVMIHRQTGFLTPLGDMDSFVNALQNLVTNPDLRKSMGARAASLVRTRHDLDQNYGKMEDALSGCIREYCDDGS